MVDNSKTCADFLFFKNSVGLVSHSDSGELDSVNLVSYVMLVMSSWHNGSSH